MKISHDVAAVPRLGDAPDCAVQVWREANGEAFAHCATVDGLHWIEMPGIARFSFGPAGGEVNAVPHPGAGPEVVRDAYRGTALPMILQARGTEVLHASAILTAQGVVAFCGESGTGKSTIAVGFNRRGYKLWADDAVAFDASRTVALPLPFRPRLRPAAAAFFATTGNGVSAGEGREEPGRAAPRPEPLAAVCILERVAEIAYGAVVERLAPSAALRSVLLHAFCFSLRDPQCKRRMIEHYVKLVERVPCFAIRFQPGLEGLSGVLETIELRVMGS